MQCNSQHENWLHQQVAPTYDAMMASPERAIPSKSVFDDIRARHNEKTKGSA